MKQVMELDPTTTNGVQGLTSVTYERDGTP